ncbi:MAG TPA: MFS transporter [Candidatus Paceibacterota bacterium]|nr:MFS transporter [Candidatus Paceibacterota bacterium]HSA02340.1 MFS transporter [Candidatus Paceibacterota bacterium]
MRTGPYYRWFVVGMLWFVCLFNYADRQAIFSVFPLLKQEMGLSDVELGIVGGAFMWVYAAALPLAGIIGDRVRRKTLILGGLIFWSVITLATAWSTQYWHLVVFRALEGFGEAFYFPASMSLISDYHGRGTRSKAMSLHQSSVYAGTILGGTVAGYCAQYYGWRSGFYLFGSLGILLGIVLMVLLEEPQRGQADADETPTGGAHTGIDLRSGHLWQSIGEIFKTRMVLILMAVFVGANFVAAIFLTWMPSFLNRKFNMSLSMAGLNSTAWLQIASVLGVLTGGWLADRLARRFVAGRPMTQAIGLFLGVPFIFLTGWTLSVPVLVLAMIGFGFFKGLYDANIWASLYDVVKVERRATALGLMNSIGWLGGGIAPVAIAAASERYGMSACLSSTSLIYLAFGLLMALGISLFMRGRSRGQPLN